MTARHAWSGDLLILFNPDHAEMVTPSIRRALEWLAAFDDTDVDSVIRDWHRDQSFEGQNAIPPWVDWVESDGDAPLAVAAYALEKHGCWNTDWERPDPSKMDAESAEQFARALGCANLRDWAGLRAVAEETAEDIANAMRSAEQAGARR